MITGFPSPAQGYESKGIDLNSVLIRHPSATVFMQIESSNYMHMGIFNGDILIIDRAKKITPNSLVVYESEGHFVLGRVFNIKKTLEDTIITGAITHVIHTVKESWCYGPSRRRKFFLRILRTDLPAWFTGKACCSFFE